MYVAVHHGGLRLTEVVRVKYQAAAQAVKRYGQALVNDPARKHFVAKLRHALSIILDATPLHPALLLGHRLRCRRRRGGGSQRRRCECGRRRRDGGIMPMAVLDGPYFARRNFARRLRCGLELNLLRHDDGLDLRCGARNGRSGLLGRDQRPEIKISSSRSQDRTTSQGQRDDQTERSSLL